MTGPHDSVIGVRTELVLRRFTTGMPVRFEPAEGDVRLEGVVVECDARRPGDRDRDDPHRRGLAGCPRFRWAAVTITIVTAGRREPGTQTAPSPPP